MNAAFEKRLAVVWIILSALTVVSLAVLTIDGPGPIRPNAIVAISAVAVSLFKVRLIIQEFMEVRHAPKFLSRLTDAWLMLTAGVLIGTYCLGLLWYS